MRIVPLSLQGAYLITATSYEDERGSFTPLFSKEIYENHQLIFPSCQMATSWNPLKGTLRGLHYQKSPFEEIKLVRCTRGALYDVLVDLRAGSPTFKQWCAVELQADCPQLVYIPQGIAHGFQTLKDETEVCYHISVPYVPYLTAAVRWDDPAFRITWPYPVSRISTKDANCPDFS